MSYNLSRKTWPERHPHKVIFLLLFLVVCGLGLLTEKILAFRAGSLSHTPGSQLVAQEIAAGLSPQLSGLQKQPDGH